MRFLALLLALLPFPAFAAEYALMVNMNYSNAEWQAFKKSSEACGRIPVSIPPLEMIPVGEALFAKRDSLAAKLQAERPEWKKGDVDNAIEEIMRNGGKWQGDPAIAQKYAIEIKDLFRQTHLLNKAEQEYGTIAEQFEETAKAIRQARGTISSFAISAHADGWNFTGESANRLSWGDLDEVLQRSPGVFRATQNVLLLGCYNMTENNRPHWNSLFPYATMIAGFGVKAPSRTRAVAREYISQNLDLACKLDNEIGVTGRALDPSLIERAFKRLSSVTGTQSVIDYCRQIIEGQPGAGNALTCDEQWTTILAQAESIQDTYMDLRSLKKNPPSFDSASSPLRIFYTALQNVCPAKNALQNKGQEKEMEDYRKSIRESVIRLIFWWRVQKNFNTYFANDLAALDKDLEEAGITAAVPPLDGKTGRVEFVKSYNDIQAEMRLKEKQLARAVQSGDLAARAQWKALQSAKDRFPVLRPLFFLQGEHTVGEGEKISPEETLARDAIPFNWIEGTVLRPRSR